MRESTEKWWANRCATGWRRALQGDRDAAACRQRAIITEPPRKRTRPRAFKPPPVRAPETLGGRLGQGAEYPMALTPDDVSRIAHLARLELTPIEQAAMLGQLNGFFRIVEQMSAVDTRGVEPLYTPLAALYEVATRLRDDVVTEAGDVGDADGLQRARNQTSAPAVQDGLYLVPKVID